MAYTPYTFGQWVQQRRQALDLTQSELADRAGCSTSALRKIESAERRPSQQLAELLAVGLDIAPEACATFVKVARGVLSLDRLGAPSLPGIAPRPRAHSLYTNLPTPSTPLIGREPELAALEQLLDDPACRLVTIVGMGGIGKTRLAIEAASRHRAKVSDGVYFVSLTPLTSAQSIVTAIADAVDISFSGPAEPFTQLINYLRTRTALLLLDNMEHLLAGAPQLADLLNNALGVKLLITSRERLNLMQEWSFDLHGLPVPPPQQSEALEQYNSVALFLMRGRHAKADFEPDREEMRAIARICHLVEGMPLGIELAAVWVPILSCEEIALEIEAGLELLTTSIRDVPERHRSMTAVFEHAWRLLSTEEQRVLNLLSIFRGGFNRQSAEQIVGASLQVLASLVAKSLVRKVEGARYDLHELVRQYAMSCLTDEDDRQVIHSQHCDYYLSLLGEREKSLKSTAQTETIRELSDDIDNIRAALAWAIENERFRNLRFAVPSFGLLCCIRGWFREGIRQLEPIVHSLRIDSTDPEQLMLLGLALAQQGRLLQLQGNIVQSKLRYQQSLGILRPLGVSSLLSYPLLFYGIVLFLSGDLDEARIVNEEGLAYAEADSDLWLMGHGQYDRGYIATLLGHYAIGYEQMMAGLSLWRESGDPATIALGLNHIAPTVIKLGRYDEAEAILRESLDLCMQVNDRWGIGTAYRHLGLVALARGDISKGQSQIRKSLAYFNEIEARNDISQSLAYLGEASVAAGDPSEARKIFLEALSIAAEVPSMPNALQALLGLAELCTQAGESHCILELTSFILLHTVSSQEVNQRAGQLRKEAAVTLTTPQIQTVEAWALEQSLESITAEVVGKMS